MDHRFVEISLFYPVSLLIDRETGVEYLRTDNAQIPVLTAEGLISQSDLPQINQDLDSLSLREFSKEEKQRFVRTKTKVKSKSFIAYHILLDQKTGVEYLLAGDLLSPLLTADGMVKTGKVEK